MGDENDQREEVWEDIIYEIVNPIKLTLIKSDLFVRSTKKQREYIDRLSRGKGMHYGELVKFCCMITKRNMKDVGEMSRKEAGLVIEKLGGKSRVEESLGELE